MPLSISSSNKRIPDIGYCRMWFVAVILFGLMVMIFETIFRGQGHLPSVVDSERFWTIHRANVYAPTGKDSIILVGSSRSQLGLVPSVMKRIFPSAHIKQLSIDGSPAFEIVRDLCEDPDFKGVLFWSATADSLLPPTKDKDRKDVSYVRFYHDEFWRWKSIEKNLNCLFGAYLQSNFVTLSPELTLKKILWARFRPKPVYFNMDFDRYRPARYYSILTEAERAVHRRKRIEQISPQRVTMDFHEFSQFITNDLLRLHKLLRDKGGELILLRMPTSGEHWRWYNNFAPKELFWDRLADLTDIPTIHFRDYPELMTFDCPDTSHLDATDSPKFTSILSRILKNKLKEKNYIKGNLLESLSPQKQ